MGRTILVVDDDLDILEIVSRTLRRMGYEVVPATSVRDAITAAGPVDGILLDFGLPNGDGRSILAHFPGIPALTMSGARDAELRKPFTLAELRQRVQMRIGAP